jgi:hypothetical protein
MSWLVVTLRAQHFWPLVEDCTRIKKLPGSVGRPPADGSWALLFVAFVLSKMTSLTEFLQSLSSGDWLVLGFSSPPAHGTVWKNLERLEDQCLGVFADAAWCLYRRLDRQLDGDVLRDWWMDCTIALSPSRYYHCCDPRECPKRHVANDRKPSNRKPQPKPLKRSQIDRAHHLPDDPDADDGQLTSDARSRETDSEPDEFEPKPKAGGVPNLPRRASIIRRLYGDVEAARDEAGLYPEGELRPTKSPLLQARDALDAFRAAFGLRPRSTPAEEHYDGLIHGYRGLGRFFSLRNTGCLYWSSDEDAAVRRKGDHRPDGPPGEASRSYENPGDSPMFGYDICRIVSLGAGTVLGFLAASAHETRLYPLVLERALERARYRPRAVVTDAIGGLRPVSDAVAQYGIGLVSPSFGLGRENSDQWIDDPHGRWDRYGIPRCRHCGAPCGFRKRRPPQSDDGIGSWRLYFDCSLPTTDGCKETQSLYMDDDTRILTTIWRDREIWWALRNTRGQHERSHHLDRKRFNVTSDQHLTRRNRKGLRHQQLLGEICMLITALQMAWLQGAIDGQRRVPKIVATLRAPTALDRFHRDYRAAKLHLARPDFVELRRRYEASGGRRRQVRRPEQLE